MGFGSVLLNSTIAATAVGGVWGLYTSSQIAAAVTRVEPSDAPPLSPPLPAGARLYVYLAAGAQLPTEEAAAAVFGRDDGGVRRGFYINADGDKVAVAAPLLASVFVTSKSGRQSLSGDETLGARLALQALSDTAAARARRAAAVFLHSRLRVSDAWAAARVDYVGGDAPPPALEEVLETELVPARRAAVVRPHADPAGAQWAAALAAPGAGKDAAAKGAGRGLPRAAPLYVYYAVPAAAEGEAPSALQRRLEEWIASYGALRASQALAKVSL